MRVLDAMPRFEASSMQWHLERRSRCWILFVSILLATTTLAGCVLRRGVFLSAFPPACTSYSFGPFRSSETKIYVQLFVVMWDDFLPFTMGRGSMVSSIVLFAFHSAPVHFPTSRSPWLCLLESKTFDSSTFFHANLVVFFVFIAGVHLATRHVRFA